MAIKSVKLPNGQVINIGEWLHWPLYSTFEWDNAVALDLRAFTYTVGQRVPSSGIAARNATISDTNQVNKARINHDESMIIFALSWEPWSLGDVSDGGSPPAVAAEFPMMHSADVKRLQHEVIVELLVGAGISKPQFRAPLSWINQSVGSPAWASGDAVAANVEISYGMGGRISPAAQRRFTLPIYIEPDRAMQLRAFTPRGAVTSLGADVRIRWYLDGMKKRPVA